MTLGRGTFTKFQNILRHGNATLAQQRKLATKFGPQPGINWNHEIAVQQWCQRQSSALVPASNVVVTESVARDRRSAFIHLRTLLETRGHSRVLRCGSQLLKWRRLTARSTAPTTSRNACRPWFPTNSSLRKRCLRVDLYSASKLMVGSVCIK